MTSGTEELLDGHATGKESVDHPDHYNIGGIECIDYLQAKLTEEQMEGFCIGNAIKYLDRYNHKGNKIQDLRKAKWYIDYYLGGLDE